MRRRIPKLFAILAAAACICGVVVMTPAPRASADALGNGYDVTCTQANGSTVTCNISGCPRVHEQDAGDVVHTKVNGGPDNELKKACGNTTTERVNASGPFTYSVQGCRKEPSIISDECGAWSDYQYTPPAPKVAPTTPCPAGSPGGAAGGLPAGFIDAEGCHARSVRTGRAEVLPGGLGDWHRSCGPAVPGADERHLDAAQPGGAERKRDRHQ
jgi:hypothetical protein